MRIYLAGDNYSRHFFRYLYQPISAEEQMQRADILKILSQIKSHNLKVNVLQSFYKISPTIIPNIRYFDDFILDSGAFTFIQGGKISNLDEYVTRYIKFINANDVKLFFELDIDKIIGYEAVKKIRRRIERDTGKVPIPVWHKSLGKKEFLNMCDEYKYVAIGGIVSKEISKDEYKYFPTFIKEAHKRGCKIHGLGFTNAEYLRICHFDSVDSTAWTYGNRAGQIYKFDGKKCEYRLSPSDLRLKPFETAAYNFVEWIKFSNYAERKL